MEDGGGKEKAARNLFHVNCWTRSIESLDQSAGAGLNIRQTSLVEDTRVVGEVFVLLVPVTS